MRPRHASVLRLLAPGLCVAAALTLGFVRIRSFPGLIDVDADVYLTGARAVVDGQPLYDVSFLGFHFTYPPFAALAFTPLLGLDGRTAHQALLVGSLLCFAFSIWVVGRTVGFGVRGCLALGVVGLITEPVTRTILLGQVNCSLLLMVLLDTLVVRGRYRGLLVGLAAGVKIIPGAFVLLFLLQRDWRAALRTGAAFLATVAIGAVAAPAASWQFWTGGFLGLGRFGDDAALRSSNQSFVGAVLRWTKTTSVPVALTLLFLAVGLALGVVVARRCLRVRDVPAAVAALAVGALLGSPISWSHHWLWIVLFLAVFARRGWWWSALLAGLTFTVAPFWLSPVASYSELTYSPVQQAVSAVYVIAGLLILLRLWSGSLPRTEPLATDVSVDSRTDRVWVPV